MSGKKKGAGKVVVLAPDSVEDARVARAFELKVQGNDYERIGEELDVSPWVARELTSISFQRLATETAEEMRAASEARYDDMLRRLYSDLRVATSQTARNSIYTLILKTEGQRSKLLGLEVPAGVPDDAAGQVSPRA